MTHGTHWFRGALLALLALAVLGGGSLAAGDLFDDAYADCPHKTRMRDGEIADLTVARDAEEADHVNVAWAATDPATWGLGPNAYSTRLVVILDDNDGDLETQTLSLGTRKTTFEGVATGTEVTVQMAIVVDAPEGDYLISDILEQSVHQSLTPPSFSSGWIIRGSHPCFGNRFPHLVEIPLDDLADGMGRMYYIGYNENFGNYRPGPGASFNTYPETPRFRIGLAHGGENDSERDDVDFDSYILRLIGEDGDIVPEGDDVPVVGGPYEPEYFSNAACTDGYYDRHLILEIDYESNAYGNLGDQDAGGAEDRRNLVGDKPFSNVRINDGGTISPATYQNPLIVWNLIDGMWPIDKIVPITVEIPNGDELYAPAPDVHRDFPVDTMGSDETYTIEAWAVNEDREVISPKATLKVHTKMKTHQLVPSSGQYPPGRLQDYLNIPLVFPVVVLAPQNGTLLLTEFTLLK